LKIDAVFIHKRLPLSIARKCGANVAIFILAGHSIETLITKHNYCFDDVLSDLRLDWDLLLKFGFAPELLSRCDLYPLITLYDALGVRATHLYDFFRSAVQLELILGPLGMRVLDIRSDVWVV
jgi:hypothetical protein